MKALVRRTQDTSITRVLVINQSPGNGSRAPMISTAQMFMMFMAVGAVLFALGVVGYMTPEDSNNKQKPKNISDYGPDFAFSDPGTDLARPDLKFQDIKHKHACFLVEDFTISDLLEYIQLFGEEQGLKEVQIKMMKVAAKSGRVLDTVESFQHGRNGQYRFTKYAVGKRENDNYDFVVANYGFKWVLDSLTPEEAVKRLDLSERIAKNVEVNEGVTGDMIPEEGQKDIIEEVEEFINIHSKTSITLTEKEIQMEYFRSQSQKGLAKMCHKYDHYTKNML